jgi:F0F1-type ATP synthase alpha subunit
MTLIQEQTNKILEEKNIFPMKYTDKSDFTEIIFSLIDPISEKELSTYSFKLSDFNNLEYKEKKRYSKLEKKTIFDETEYLKECKKQKQMSIIYQKEYDKLYDELLKKNNISKDINEKLKKIMDIISDEFELTFNGHTDENKAIIEFEQDIINVLKS